MPVVSTEVRVDSEKDTISGYVDGFKIIEIVLSHDGHWKVGTSTAFPVNIDAARVYHEVYDRVFKALGLFQTSAHQRGE